MTQKRKNILYSRTFYNVITFLGVSISGYINLETLDIYQSQE